MSPFNATPSVVYMSLTSGGPVRARRRWLSWYATSLLSELAPRGASRAARGISQRWSSGLLIALCVQARVPRGLRRERPFASPTAVANRGNAAASTDEPRIDEDDAERRPPHAGRHALPAEEAGERSLLAACGTLACAPPTRLFEQMRDGIARRAARFAEAARTDHLRTAEKDRHLVAGKASHGYRSISMAWQENVDLEVHWHM